MSATASTPDDQLPAPEGELIDLHKRRPNRPLAISYTALRRYNDLIYKTWTHERRELSRFEAFAIVHEPSALGLGHGPVADLRLNPAEDEGQERGSWE